MSFTNALNPNVGKITSTGLDKLFYSYWNLQDNPEYLSGTDSLVFNQYPSLKGSETIEEFVGVGSFELRGELQKAGQGQPRSKNTVTYVHDTWAKGVEISKEMEDDDQFMAVDMLVRSLASNGRLKRDDSAMSIFRTALAGTANIGDGVPLFSNSHPSETGVLVDNLETVVASESGLTTACISLQQQKNRDGQIGGHMPAFLISTPTDYNRWTRILESELRSGTANNDTNVYSAKYGIVLKMSPFLGSAVSGGSDNYWVLGSRNHTVCRFDRKAIETQYIPRNVRENGSSYYAAEFRHSVGAASYVGMVGSSGTTGTKDA